MRKLICFSIALLIGLSCFGQEIEFCGSLNSSHEQRFQNAQGIGLQYQQDISKRFKVGLGVHYNSKYSNFTEIPYIDGLWFPPSIEKINSKSQRFSLRLNIQGLLKDNENVSISLGPEISYNYLWGQDNINAFWGGDTKWNNYSQSNSLIKVVGIGLISKIEVKGFMIKQLSLCFTVRPEVLFGKNYDIWGGSPPVFASGFSFTEFQIGLKYRFKK